MEEKSATLARQYRVFCFILLISATLILGMAVIPANAARKADVPQIVSATETSTKTESETTSPASADEADMKNTGNKIKLRAKSAATNLAPGTKININKADRAMLEKLPEIGQAKAKAIIAGRPYNTIEDVMKVKGIKGKTFDVIKDYIVVK